LVAGHLLVLAAFLVPSQAVACALKAKVVNFHLQRSHDRLCRLPGDFPRYSLLFRPAIDVGNKVILGATQMGAEKTLKPFHLVRGDVVAVDAQGDAHQGIGMGRERSPHWIVKEAGLGI